MCRRSSSRCSRKCRGTVPVVGERDPRRQCARLGQCARGHPGRGDGKGPGLAGGKGGGGRAGDPGRLVDREGEGLGGVRPTTFVAVIVNGYVPPGPAAGVPASVAVPSPLSVNVTPVGSAPVSDNAHVGHPGRRDGKGPGRPTVKVVAAALVIAARMVDREGEGLGGARTATVLGGDRERVCAAGARSRCSRKCRRAVPVVGERDSRRQCARSDNAQWAPRST